MDLTLPNTLTGHLEMSIEFISAPRDRFKVSLMEGQSWGDRFHASALDLIFYGVRRPILTLQHVRIRALDLMEEHGDWTPGFTKAAAMEAVYGGVLEAVRFFSGVEFPVRVYRGVRSPAYLGLSVDDIREKSGEHWTPTKGIAENFARGVHHMSCWKDRRDSAIPYLLTGSILRPEDVRWENSAGLYLRWSASLGGDPKGDHEREDELMSGKVADVSVLEAGRDGTFKVEGSRAAPGYRSWSWIQQDWRSVQRSGDGLKWDRACGAPGTRSADDLPALCLPRSVIESLASDPIGLQILKDQVKKKSEATPGARVKWHPQISKLHKELERKTPKDRRKANKR